MLGVYQFRTSKAKSLHSSVRILGFLLGLDWTLVKTWDKWSCHVVHIYYVAILAMFP